MIQLGLKTIVNTLGKTLGQRRRERLKKSRYKAVPVEVAGKDKQLLLLGYPRGLTIVLAILSTLIFSVVRLVGSIGIVSRVLEGTRHALDALEALAQMSLQS